MAETAKKKAGNVALWIIVGLLCVGLAGFSVGNFGSSRQAIGHAGDKPIYAQNYYDGLNAQIRQFEQATGSSLSFPEAQAIGIPQSALQQVVTQRALENEAAILGVSISDETVREQILSERAFQSLDGQFDREQYRQSLQFAGQTEKTFEQQLREGGARQLLEASVVTGLVAPETFVSTLVDFAAERRDFTWALMGEADLITPVGAPSDADLQTVYQENPDDYTLPEARRITYVWLTPDMILDDVTVDEDALVALYEERVDFYQQPERRLVERLVYPSLEEAEQARAQIDVGGTFDTAVQNRGLELSDVDMGDVSKADLGPAGDAVFEITEPGVVGPVESSLGPALFRVNAILPAREVTLEDARNDLQNELAQDRARRVIEQQLDAFDNELAAGATLEELADTTDMRLATIDYHSDVDTDIAAYTAFRAAADQAQESDFPELATLEDGGVFALRLDTVVPPALQDFADVKDQVTEAWRATAVTAALQGLAERLLPQIEAGIDMAGLGLTAAQEVDITRGSFIPGAPAGFLDTVFSMEPGDLKILPGESAAVIIQLNAVTEASDDDPDAAAFREAIAGQIAQSYAQDVYAAFSAGVVARTDVTLNQQMINGLHAQIQ